MRTRRRSRTDQPWLIAALAFVAGLAFRGKAGWSTLGALLFAGWLAWSVAVAWWEGLAEGWRVLIILMVVGLVAFQVWRWADARWGSGHVPGVQERHRRRPPAEGEPPRVLYRWYEPDDLPDGEVCYCGKSRRAGELVYIGKTHLGRQRELDDDRLSSCWWRPELEGTTKLYGTEGEVLVAEKLAIGREHPRENVAHNGVRVW